MKQTNIIALLCVIMLFSIATGFFTANVFIGELLPSLGLISGALCSGQLLKQQQS